MERKRISTNLQVKSSGFSVSIGYLIISVIRQFADTFVLAFLLLASSANFNGIESIGLILFHLAIGFALAGLIISPRKSSGDILLASLGSLISLSFLAIPFLLGNLLDPIFLGFSLGFGFNYWGSSLLVACNLNKTTARQIDNAGMVLFIPVFLGGLLCAQQILPPPDQIIFPAFKFLVLAQGISFICTLPMFIFCKNCPVPTYKETERVYPSSWRDDFTPLIARSLISGIVLGLAYLILTGSIQFISFNWLFESNNFLIMSTSSLVGVLFLYFVNHPLRTVGSAPWSMVLCGLAFFSISFFPETSILGTALLFLGLGNTLACIRRACRPEDILQSKAAHLLFSFAPWLFGIFFGWLFAFLKLTPVMAGFLLIFAGVALAWVTLRAFIEQLVSLAMIPMFKLTALGPGLEQMPYRGPVIIVANHCCYLDPFLVGKIGPRRIIPMMTSVFYDLPVIRWLVAKVVKAIRVEAATFRREAPELEEAIAVLKQGENLLIFPEARLRRKDNQLLFPFGQGIWHILCKLPDTPIIPIWVEGTWGSFTSNFNGPPLTNKKMDWLRTIKVVVGESRTIPKDLLADHRLTRKYLQDAVLENRLLIGLPKTLPYSTSPTEEHSPE